MKGPKPMLCHDGKGRAFPSGAAWVIEPKLDGWRFLFHVKHSEEVRSYAGRNGSDRTGQPAEIEDCLRWLPPDTIIDAELVVLGESSPAVATALAHPGRSALHAVLFDVLRVAGHDVTRKPWHDRRELLDALAEGFDGIAVTLTEAQMASEMIHRKHLECGYEGSVVKRTDSIYRPGRRSREWIKFKPQETADALVLGFEVGEGSWAGQVGAFEIELLGTDVRTTCAVPTKAMRAEITEDPQAYVGKIIEVRHHGEMDSGLLRHPVFSRWRPDLDREEQAA